MYYFVYSCWCSCLPCDASDNFSFLELHSTTQTLTTRAHSPLWTHVRKSYHMSISKGLSNRQIWSFPKSLWALEKISRKCASIGFEHWWVAFHCTVLPLAYKPTHTSWVFSAKRVDIGLYFFKKLIWMLIPHFSNTDLDVTWVVHRCGTPRGHHVNQKSKTTRTIQKR
jgi:hypothetical protein